MMDFRNSNGFEFWNFYSTTLWKLSRKCLSVVEKCITWSSIQVLPNQVSKKSFYSIEDITLRESPVKLHKKPSETLGAVCI